MTNPPEQNESRIDRIEAAQERAQVELTQLRQLIESNAKAIQSQGNQSAADRDLSRQSREDMRQLSRENREDIRDLTALVRDLAQANRMQEREIRLQAGEIQNLADSIQHLYSRQSPPPS
jgi:hypothetical protein